jgi:hypothetical protein
VSGLLDDIQTANDEATRPNRCVIQKVLEQLSDEDQKDLIVALADPGIMHVAIARALRNRGFEIGTHGKTISTHRKGQCGCARG